MRKLVQVFLFISLFTAADSTYAQKIGLVLSGGGASGLAHIGVIKALEENHIPIDYVSGTSMGAFIGAMYAAGFTPAEMEKIVTSPDFQRIAKGTINSKFVYYFKQPATEASWVNFRFSLDTSIITSIPTHLVSPVPIDFALLKYFTGPSAAANNSFDNLFVPFRCVAADIVEKKPHIFKDGNLGEAIRASISYPFYLKPIVIDGKMYFDGGLYNNFPADIMQQDFHPDVILGSNVSGNIEPPTDDNILSEIKNMLMTKTNYTLDGKGKIIVPNVEAGILTADHPKALIDSGYVATMRQMPAILEMISRREDSVQLAQRRQAFKNKQRPLIFKNLSISGLNSSQEKYERSILNKHNDQLAVGEVEKRYYKVATDPDIHSIYPLASLDTSGFYKLDANIKREKHFSVGFGGVISNRPISEGYVGLQYNYLGKEELNLDANTYFGKLYTSAMANARIYFPTALPFYIEPALIYNRIDYFTSSTEFFEDIQPPYLTQDDEFGKIDLGLPVGMSSKLIFGSNLTNIISNYYQGVKFAPTDTADRTELDAITEYVKFETNTLNRKQYASAGTRIFFEAQYVDGKEFYYPGSLDISRKEIVNNHEWGQLKLSFDNYYKQRGLLRLGIYVEGVYSYTFYPLVNKSPLQTFFTNYYSTALMAPAFQPTPESQTLFLPNYRAYNYVAGGPKLIISFKPNIDLRFEGYIFLPYQSIQNTNNLATYGTPLATKHYIGVASIVYNSPVGPVGLSLNYYDGDKLNSLSLLFHIGFIIFNEKSIN